MLTRKVKFLLGTNRKTKEDVYLSLKKNGVMVVISKPRTGKSALVKEIALRVGEARRPVLIVDSLGRGEWSKTARKNYRADYPQGFEKLKVLKDFAVPINAFKTIDDFISLGFTQDAAGHMVEFVKNRFLADPVKMDEFLMRLPATIKDLADFNADYKQHGLDMAVTLHFLTKNNIVTHWRRCKDWFWSGEKDKRMCLTPEILEEIWFKNHYLCLQIDAQSGERHKSIAYIGTLLGGLDDNFLKIMSPVVVLEEADLICPHERFNKQQLTSRNVLRGWVNKKLRFGMFLVFITQTERLLDEEIIRSAFDKIIGMVDKQSFYYDRAKYNRMRKIDDFPRCDFIYVDVNDWGQQFYPKITSCGCES